MNVATLNPDPLAPLDPAHQQQFAAAESRAHTIRKAAGIARFNGWTIGILALCAAPFSLGSWPGFLLTVGMAAVAYNELRGRRRLMQFDESAARFLGWNQLGFLALIAVYCVWMLSVGMSNESPFAAELRAKPELQAVFGAVDGGVEGSSVDGFDQYYHTAIVVFYGMVLLLSVVFQGGNAVYYFTRQKHIRAYRQATPEWIVDLQRLAAPH